MKNGNTQGPAAASSTPIAPMYSTAIRMMPLPTLNAQSRRLRADGLADQRGARHRDAHRGHVAKRGQHHDDLRRRAVDRAEAHLHQLEQREAENVGGDQQSHRESQLQLAPAAPARAAASVRCER